MDSRQRVWKLFPECRILGPVISCNGSTAIDQAKAFAAIRACYFRNARFLCNQRVPLARRLQKLDQVAHGIIRSRAAAWPPCRTTEEAIDRLQFQILGFMQRLRKAADETPQQYAIRRGRTMSRATQSQWSLVHLESCLSWLSHMQRHPDCPAARALSTQDSEWVKRQRTTSGSITRTNTRSAAAKVYRWDQVGWTRAFDPAGTRDKERVRALARALLENLRCKVRH